MVANEVIAIWKDRRRRIKSLKEKKHIIRSLQALHDQYYVLKKDSKKTTSFHTKKRDDFMKENENEFDIEATSTGTKTQNTNIEVMESPQSSQSIVSSQSSSTSNKKDDKDYVPVIRNRSKSFTLIRPLAGALDRSKISNRRASLLILSAAKAMNVDLTEVNISTETVRRQRAKERDTMNKEIRATFTMNSENKKFVVHWDSKLLENFTNTEIQATKVHRLAIVLSSGKEMKLLGIPTITKGSGVMQFNAVMGAINEWQVKDKIVGMSFDTTAANTGGSTGTCIQVYNDFNQRILYLACRHHIHELVLKRIFNITMEKSTTAPTVPLFDRFKSSWLNVNKTIFEPGVNDDFVDSSFETAEKHQLIDFCRRQLEIQHAREDHRELLQLALMWLGANDRFTVRKPGATIRARFMSHAIYSIKIFLFRAQFALSSKYNYDIL